MAEDSIQVNDDSGENVLESVKPMQSAPDAPAPEAAMPQPEAPDAAAPTPKFSNWDDMVANAKPENQPKYKSWNEMVEKEQPTIQSAFTDRMTATTPTELSEAQRIWAQNSYLGDVFKQFGTGYVKSVQENMFLEPETVKAIKDFGAWKGFSEGEDAVNKSFMDGTVLPAVRNLYENTRQTYVAPAAVGLAELGNTIMTNINPFGAPLEGAMAALEQVGKETGTGGALPAALEYATTTAEGLGALGTFGAMELGSRSIPESVLLAKAHGVLEEDGVFSGVKNPTPEQSKSMADAASAIPEKIPDVEKTVHEVARSIDPIPFQAYDVHVQRREALRDQYAKLREDRNSDIEENAPHNDEIASLNEKLEDANPRKTKIYQEKIDALTEKNEAWKEEQRKIESTDMAVIKEKLLDVDNKLMDLARTGRIAKAYRAAEERMPAPVEKEPTVQEAVSKDEEQAVAKEPHPQEIPPGPERPIEEQHSDIVSDVTKRLTNAGRPQDEAEAAAKLIASHYKTVSEQGWAKGTPEEIYQKHAADIKSGSKPAKTLSQPEGGKTLTQKAKGKIRLGVDGARNIISLFKTADASTFIHELGHHWLEEMMSFASDKGAPQTIKDHLSTVRDWLGSKDGEEITTRQHEKFARGFERYMMEGTAPSKGLANVFSQFKKWLTSIYQTVDRLKSPITDNIRDVFDRLIVSNPEKTVIAPEIDSGKTLENAPGTHEFTNFAENYPKTLEGTNQAAKEFVVQKGAATGHEHMVAVDKDGAALHISEGDKESVSSDSALFKKLKDPKNEVIIHHNHQRDVGLSEGDISTLGAMGEKEINAHTPNGSTFSASLSDGMRKALKDKDSGQAIKDLFDISHKAAMKSLSLIQDLVKKGLVEPGDVGSEISKSHTEIFNRALDKAGLIDYKSSADMKGISKELANQVIDKTAEAIRSELEKYGYENVKEKTAGHEPGIPNPGELLPRQGGIREVSESSGGVGETPKAGEASGASDQSGVGVARSAERAAGTVPDPNEPLGEPESPFVDKAGNIRLDNLDTSEDVKSTLRDLAAQNDDFQAARGGVISDSQRSAMADSLGLTMDNFKAEKPSGVSSSVWADAVQKLTFQATDSVTNIGKEFAENGTEENWVKYLQAKQRLLMIADHFSTVTAEAGRTLQVFDKSKMKFTEDVKSLLQHESGKDLFQMQREAKLLFKLDTAAKRAKFLQDSRKPSGGDMILEYWINGLISGPATHMTYSVGNTLLSLWRAIPETAAASGISKIHEILGHGSSGISLGEVGAKLKGGIKGIPTAVSAAGSALKTGVTSLLPGEDPWTLPFQTATENPVRGVEILNKNITWKELGAQTYGAVKGMRDAFVATGNLIKNGGVEGAPLFDLKRSSLGAIPDVAIKGVNVPVGTVLRLPGRSIAGIHSFFRTVGYSMEKSAMAYRDAGKESLSDIDFAKRVNEIETNPSEEIMKQSRSLATEATLMARGGEFTQNLSKITNLSINLPGLGETKLLKFIDPFVHISSNILDQTLVQRTPIGLLSKDMRNDLMGKNGAVMRDQAQARMLVGTALAATAGGLAAEGLMSGSGPSNAHERGIWIAAGNQPHSVKVDDVWYDIHRLGPLGMVMSIGADMYDVAHAMGKEDSSIVATMLAHAISQNVLDESFMRGPAELIQATTDSERYGPQYVRNFASSFLPYSVGMSQVTRATDPYTRQARTVMDAFRAKIPWESQSLMPRRDVWGEPVLNRDVLGVKGLSAIYETKVNHDPVNKTLLSLGFYPSQPGKSIRGVKLSDPQYDDYSRIAGRLTKQRLDNIVAQSGFSQIPPGKQVEVMRKIIETSRESARRAIMMKYPEIMQQAVDQKRQILMGKK